MNQVEQKQAAKRFAERWQAEECNEDRQARSFWIEFAQDVMGIANPTYVLDFERKVKGRKIDVFYEDMGVLIEQKSRGVDLDKKSERSKKAGEETPYQQAKWYADNLPYSVRPRWIIVSNFDEFRIHDLDAEDPEHDYVTVGLAELPDQVHLFDFLTDRSASRLVKEQELSVQAGEIVGRLYKSLFAQYKNIDTDPAEQRSLNILIVRFVFLLYAEDAGLLQEHQAFLNYMRNIEPENFRDALRQLFEVLDTPENERDPYLNERLAAFPYINGSLFAETGIIIPQFTQQIKYDLLKEASQDFDWSGISPTIFGAAFESTLNPETRRAGGMHYTSIENIHKVIDPLFLDDLKAELAEIEGEKVEKTRNLKLRAFQNRLAGIKVLDPACGSGNFLTESYLSLRRLENRVLENLMGDQMGLGFAGDANPIKVSIDQFYGIEINDFAVAVAKTALWIAEEQTMDITQEILLTPLQFLPLTSNNNIVQANALRMDWDDLLPAEKCNYIIGNPPFVGYKEKSKEQKTDLEEVCITRDNKKIRNVGSIDYVAGWYYKSARYILNNPSIRAALVSTSSITQGEQVCWMWLPLIEGYGLSINFAYPSFIWDSEASDKAHVHVVIVGFSLSSTKPILWDASKSAWNAVAHINPYLVDAPNAWIQSRRKTICDVPAIKLGVHLLDNHEFIFSNDEHAAFIAREPHAAKYFKKWVSASDFLYGKNRWYLDLSECPEQDLQSMPLASERVQNVIRYRSSNKSAQETSLATDPYKVKQGWKADCSYIAIPNTSSERRKYLPIEFMEQSTVITMPDLALPLGGLYEFGIISSRLHMLWVGAVAGRLKSDYRYSGGVVYNNFIWPDPTPEQKQAIEQAAQAVLDARDAHPGKSLADLYDPDKMPSDLLAAHKALDKAVEEAYGVNFNGDEEKIVAHLFRLYAEATSE